MKFFWQIGIFTILTAVWAAPAKAQQTDAPRIEFAAVAPEKLRPNTRAYLDNLKRQLIVTDDPTSRVEVSPAFLRHNFNRISALRTFVTNYAATSESDFVPELSAVNEAELRTLFIENTPTPTDLTKGAVVNRIYRFLGTVKNAEIFYIFERLNPFEEEIARGASGTGSAASEEMFLEVAAPVQDRKQETKNEAARPRNGAEKDKKDGTAASKPTENSNRLKPEVFIEKRDRREIFTKPNNPKR